MKKDLRKGMISNNLKQLQFHNGMVSRISSLKDDEIIRIIKRYKETSNLRKFVQEVNLRYIEIQKNTLSYSILGGEVEQFGGRTNSFYKKNVPLCPYFCRNQDKKCTECISMSCFEERDL